MNKFNAKNMLVTTLIKGGISVNLEGNAPTKGYMVSLPHYEKRLDKEMIASDTLSEIEEYLQKHKDFVGDNGLFYGMWMTDTEIVLDLSQNFEDKELAVVVGISRDQKAIHDLNNGKDIFLPQRQKTGTLTQQRTYLTMLVREVLAKN